MLLFLALLTSAVSSARATVGDDAVRIPRHHRSIDHDEVVLHPDGGTTITSLHGSVPKKIVELGPDRDQGGVLATRCTADFVEIYTTTPEWWLADSTTINFGTVIVAPPTLGCSKKDKDTESDPFYRCVVLIVSVCLCIL